MTTIKFWLMPNAGFDSKESIDCEIKRFHESNPKIDVDYEILSWTLAWSRLIEAVKEKSGPDIIQVGTTWIGTLSYLGAIQNIDSKKVQPACFNTPFYGMCRVFDHLWALPWFCEGRVLYYRKDYLKNAGVGADSLDTWDGFKLACSTMMKKKAMPKDATPLGFSSQKEQAILQDIASWIWSNGGDFLSTDGKHATMSQFECRQGLKFFLDLISSNHISKASLELSSGEVAENFFLHNGNAFLFSSSWPLQVYLNPASKHYIGKKNAANIGIVPVPGSVNSRFNFAGGSALSVTSFSRNPDKAWKFLEFLTSKESQERYCHRINMLPGRIDVPASLDIDPVSLRTFSESINRYGRSFPSHPLWGSIEQIIVNGLVQSLREYRSGFNQGAFFQNVAEINQEIEYILSVFGE